MFFNILMKMFLFVLTTVQHTYSTAVSFAQNEGNLNIFNWTEMNLKMKNCELVVFKAIWWTSIRTTMRTNNTELAKR